MWALITIIRHTGIRISEALVMSTSCLTEDFQGKKLWK